MRTSFDLYVRGNTWLHRLDPRVKFLFVIEASLVLFLWPTIWMAAAMIVLCTLILWRARIPAQQVARIWRMMGPLMVMVFVLTALFARTGQLVWFRIGPLEVTFGAVQWGAVLALRLLGLALIVFVWLLSTDQAAMVRGFRAMKLPYEWGLTLALALRYIPIFTGLFRQVQEAQQARGLDLERGGLWQRLNSYRPILISMVIIAIRQSEQLGWALEARALGAQGVQRSVFRPLALRRVDILALALLAALFAIVVVAWAVNLQQPFPA